MKTQHDTKLLENVVQSISEKLAAPARQLEQASERLTKETDAAAQAQVAAAMAQSQRRILLAEGIKILLVVIAAAILVLSLGLAARMVMSANSTAAQQTSETAAVNSPIPFIPQTDPTEQTVDGGVITTDFSVFRNATVMLGDREFKVSAGHSFAHERDQTFEHAWCYTRAFVDGLSLQIDLATLEPNGVSNPSFVPPETLRKAGISAADLEKLRRNCPWLDGNPNQAARVTSAKTHQFAGDVNEQNVDKMIAAINSGAEVVEFASPGGLIHEAIRGHEAIKNAGVSTVAVGECASACTLLFLGGAERKVQPEGSIAVHQWSTDSGKSYDADAQLTSALLVQLIETAGVSNEFYIAAATTPAETLYTLSRNELREWGVVTG